MGEARIAMAAVGAPHGVRGEVRLNVFAEDPSVLAKLGPYRTDDGREVTIRSVRVQGGRLIARLDGVEDRDAAAALTGATLTLDRAALPPIAEEETFYHADLIGLAAELADGTALGRVTAVPDFGAGDLLEITLEEGGQALVPFTKAIVLEVDLAAGRLCIDPPEGLLD
jgi:16S rRNA processing protein RimM